MTDKTTKVVAIAGFAIGVILLAGPYVSSFFTANDGVGVPGGLLIENYIPAILYNDGYKSAKDIVTTGSLTAASTTLGSPVTIPTSNTATSSLTTGCITTVATSTATPIHLSFGNGVGASSAATTTFGTGVSVGLVTWSYGVCS